MIGNKCTFCLKEQKARLNTTLLMVAQVGSLYQKKQEKDYLSLIRGSQLGTKVNTTAKKQGKYPKHVKESHLIIKGNLCLMSKRERFQKHLKEDTTIQKKQDVRCLKQEKVENIQKKLGRRCQRHTRVKSLGIKEILQKVRRTDVLKKILVMYAFAVTIAVISFFAGKVTTENRLVAEHRQQFELARQRAAFLTDTLEDIRTEAGAIGASLDRQRTSVADLRELIGEVRTRYEKMEELLSCVGRDDSDAWNIDSGTDNVDEGEISDE